MNKKETIAEHTRVHKYIDHLNRGFTVENFPKYDDPHKHHDNIAKMLKIYGVVHRTPLPEIKDE